MNRNEDMVSRAVELLFMKQRGTFLGIAASMVHDEEVAKDIINESFMALWEKRNEVDDFVDYLFVTVRNKCLRYRRDDTAHKAVYDNIARTEMDLQALYTSAIENFDISKLHEKEITNIVYSELAKMPAGDRKIFMMKKFEGKTYKEISAELGVTASVIDHSLRNTMAVMRKALSDFAPFLLLMVSMLDS